jgi:nucleotide-binding universal stress UspA family protein
MTHAAAAHPFTAAATETTTATQAAGGREASSAPGTRVVVGLDGSGHSDLALDWAVAEAVAWSRPLHLVHARETLVTAWSPMMVVPTDVDDEVWVVDRALDRVRALAPDLSVSGVTITGPAVAALADVGAPDDTLVVGARGRGVVGSILLGSTSLHVATHARCPVVVVRDTRGERAADVEHRHTGPGGHDKPSPTAPVVVGYDGSPGSQDALGFAFTEAAHRHLPLDVVASWEPDVRSTARLAPTVADEVRAAAAGQRRDDAVSAVTPWRERYPSVDVRILVTTEQPVPSLLGRSYDASIVVVGSRGLGSVRGPLLGSVSSAVLHGAHCPVAIVRSPAAG